MTIASDPVEPLSPRRPRPERPGRGRFWIMLVFALVAFAAIAWSIGWVLLSIQLRATLDGWMDHRRAVGDRLTHGERELDGFPFRIRFTYADVAWQRVDGLRTLMAATDRLVVSAEPWDPLTLQLQSPGAITGSWQAPSLAVSLTAASAEGALAFAPSELDHVALDLRNAVAVDGRREVVARAGRLVVQADPTPTGEGGDVPSTLELFVLAEALEPTDLLTPNLPFDGAADGRIRAVVHGPLPISLDPASLALWRDAGGVIDVEHLGLNWKPVDLTAEGTLTLDGMMRPEGAASAEIRGLPAMIDRSVDHGLLAEDMATLLRLATAAFTSTGSDGGSPSVRAPLTIQDGRLSLGPFKLLSVPSLVR